MLRELRVRNLAVIESLTVPFGPGLNVLTGETGAGKSILIDALTLLLGERAQPAETIRAEAETATIEAVFDAPRKSPVATLLEEHGHHAGGRRARGAAGAGARGPRARVRERRQHHAGAPGAARRDPGRGPRPARAPGAARAGPPPRPARRLRGPGSLRDRLRQRHDEWRGAAAELEALRVSARDQVARTTAVPRVHGGDRRRAAPAGRGGGASRGAPAAPERRAPGRGRHRRLPGALRRPRLGRRAGWARGRACSATSRGSTRRSQPTIQALDTALVHLDETARALRSYRDGVVFDPPRLDAIDGGSTRSGASSGSTGRAWRRS